MTGFKTPLVLGLVALLVLTACTSRPAAPGPVAAPEQVSTPAIQSVPRPTPVAVTVCGDTQESSELGAVVQRLGFALTPRYVPPGFQTSRASLDGGSAYQRFQNPLGNLIIAYPVDFTPEDPPLMQELGMLRPGDALSEIGLSGKRAYLMRGGWSDATIMAGPSIQPDQAEWDYEKSITLFFECQVSEGMMIGVAIQALPNPSEWISETELIKMALSMARVLPPQERSSG